MSLLKSLILFIVCGATSALIAQNPLPNVSAKTLDGQVVNIPDLAKDGGIKVISFWATWCSPCKKELDAIADLYPDWQEEYGVELIAISIDTRRAVSKVPALVETKGWEYTVLSGDEQVMQSAFNFQTIPQTYLVDQNGNIVYTHNGYVPGDEEELEEKIAELAKK
ncbi:MAG: TlpA family protein disulfide reductase [Bacteroidetes bacterium]|nr:MAG: TlpA family protein disulfide reductase [Bacteroidota bacterium]